jgi:hypothetical protein
MLSTQPYPPPLNTLHEYVVYTITPVGTYSHREVGEG